MKKVFHCLLAQLFFFVIVSSARADGVQPGTFTVSGIIGGYTFDGKQHLETRPVIGIRGGYNFTKYVSMEALFDFVSTESTRAASGDAKIYRFGGDFLLNLLPENKLVPYLAAGYGGIKVDRDNQQSVTKGVFDYGPGIKYFLTDDLALRGDFRHLIFKDNDTLSNYEYTVGITYQFGGVKSASAPASTVTAATQPEPQTGPAPVVENVPEAPLENIPAAEPAQTGMKYCVSLNIMFDIDKTNIRPEYRDEVARVGDFMKKNPTTTAVIEGYADEVGSDDYNMRLSQQRAESVVEALITGFGIDSSRLSAKGFGKTMPVADNTTDEGRQKNRRIDAIIDCALKAKDVSPPPDRLCIGLNIEFATGSAEIAPVYYDKINEVGNYMQMNPTTTANIEGHTDNVGGYELNMKLSRQRAENVVNILVKTFGIERSRLSATGYGDTRRIAYNTTPEGRQKNRRINAIIDCVIKK